MALECSHPCPSLNAIIVRPWHTGREKYADVRQAKPVLRDAPSGFSAQDGAPFREAPGSAGRRRAARGTEQSTL